MEKKYILQTGLKINNDLGPPSRLVQRARSSSRHRGLSNATKVQLNETNMIGILTRTTYLATDGGNGSPSFTGEVENQERVLLWSTKCAKGVKGTTCQGARVLKSLLSGWLLKWLQRNRSFYTRKLKYKVLKNEGERKC